MNRFLIKKLLIFTVLFLLPLSSWAGFPGFMKAKMGTLQGQVNIEGEVLKNGIVSFFDKSGGPPPILGSARRVPDMVTRTDDQGVFTVKLLPGLFYMGAMVRKAEDGPGPPRPGEQYFFIMDDSGKLREFEVKTREISEAGIVKGQSPGKFKEFKDFVTISGVITDHQGNPAKGIMVNLKESMKSPRPKYVSEKTGGDGQYELKVPPGKYYVMARESLSSGRPKAGSLVGTYGKTSAPAGEPSAVATKGRTGTLAGGALRNGEGEAIQLDVKGGEVLTGINIQMFKIPDPEETRKKYEAEARAGRY